MSLHLGWQNDPAIPPGQPPFTLLSPLRVLCRGFHKNVNSVLGCGQALVNAGPKEDAKMVMSSLHFSETLGAYLTPGHLGYLQGIG